MSPTHIRLSNLAARYYKSDGWKLELLTKYLISQGREGFLRQNFMCQDNEYYILSVGASINVDSLLADYPEIVVQPFCPTEKTKSKKDLLLSRNW